MIKRSGTIAATALLLVTVVLSVGGWFAWTLVQRERQQAHERDVAARNIAIRLALWRLETAIAPMISVESARPAGEYVAARSVDHGVREGSEGGDEDDRGQSFTTSPLLGRHPARTHLHFSINADGSVSSPQVIPAELKDLPLAEFSDGKIQTAAAAKLAQFQNKVSLESIKANALQTADLGAQDPRRAELTRRDPDSTEYVYRSSRVASAVSYGKPSPYPSSTSRPTGADSGSGSLGRSRRVSVTKPGKLRRVTVQDRVETAGLLRAQWIGHELLLLRRARFANGETVQGVWLNREKLLPWLEEQVQDLLPGAQLREAPRQTIDSAPHAHRLAALPLVLSVPTVPALAESALAESAIPASLKGPLSLALGALGVSLVAVLALLWGVVALSERRAAFVSAVTHELRTPLTTVQTYSEMLVDGKVADPGKRDKYVLTIHREAKRLGHLIDNVLAYSRIESGRAKPRRETIDVDALVTRMSDRLRTRTDDSKVGLEIKLEKAGTVNGDPIAIEQILFNLVDNACKYGEASDTEPICLCVETAGKSVDFVVSNPGSINSAQLATVFLPFNKSAEHAASTAPGVGLGLALSRRLAQTMNGTLSADCRDGMTRFTLRLPRGPVPQASSTAS